MGKSSMRSSVSKALVLIVLVGAMVAFVSARPGQGQTATAAKPAPKAQTNAPSPAASPQAQEPAEAVSNLNGPYSGLGTVPTKDEMGNLAFASGFGGKDLPEGSGTAKLGADIFAGRCSMCHGANAEGVHWAPMAFSPLHGPRLGGGNGVPAFNRPPDRIVTLAYSAPSPMVLFDTIAVEMPMFRAGTLKPDQVYSLTAFILFKNGLIKEDDVMNRETLSHLKMPNASTFPASDDVYMDMSKRGCYQTYGVCLGD
jgi:S-disulfanyl-L-cysteine oxidoreductase SoxD